MTPDVPARFPTAAARVSLASRLRLPYHPAMQDWEWEVADPARLDELLAAYSSGGLSADERFALMEMLIQCVEDAELPAVGASPQWRAVAALLIADPTLHASSVRYWSCLDGGDAEECFGVTGPMREVWQVIQGAGQGPAGLAECQ